MPLIASACRRLVTGRLLPQTLGVLQHRQTQQPTQQLVRAMAKTPESVGYAREVVLPYVVSHDSKNQQFYIQLKGDDGKVLDHKAILEYQWIKKGVVDLYHTSVPPEFRGKGIAQVLAKSAFDYVVENDSKMRLSCTYLQKYLKDNPTDDYQSRTIPLE